LYASPIISPYDNADVLSYEVVDTPTLVDFDSTIANRTNETSNFFISSILINVYNLIIGLSIYNEYNI